MLLLLYKDIMTKATPKESIIYSFRGLVHDHHGRNMTTHMATGAVAKSYILTQSGREGNSEMERGREKGRGEKEGGSKGWRQIRQTDKAWHVHH